MIIHPCHRVGVVLDRYAGLLVSSESVLWSEELLDVRVLPDFVGCHDEVLVNSCGICDHSEALSLCLEDKILELWGNEGGPEGQKR